MEDIIIRHTRHDDIKDVVAIYDNARRYMRACGNTRQWVDGYPSEEDVRADIVAGNSYVGVEVRGDIVMTFAFITGADPTYGAIDGAWLNDTPYGTVHRMASNGSHPGMLRRCVEFCMHTVDSLRLDTHEDNIPMRTAAERLGFRQCGIIICSDGTPRIAYHKIQ